MSHIIISNPVIELEQPALVWFTRLDTALSFQSKQAETGEGLTKFTLPSEERKSRRAQQEGKGSPELLDTQPGSG